jgi:predicted RNA-binding protein YlxR (DUF448 family)
VACRTIRPKRDLTRIVRTAAGDVMVDLSGRAAGRGAYVCRTGGCLDKAINTSALSRALKTPLPAGAREALSERAANMNTIIEGGMSGQE